MKYLHYLTILSLLIISILSCRKENDPTKPSNDSIPLFYQKLDSNTTSFRLPDSSTVSYVTYTVIIYSGPHPYERTNTVIKTSDTNMMVCCGKDYYYADLDVDSLINNNLAWTYTVYLSYNLTLMDYISVNPKYIGLRNRNGGKINYGWVQCSKGKFVDFAIDTSFSLTGNIKAGKRYKYF
jgi:hypothetical protein